MLRMYIAQQCFGLSDEGVEDVIYDSQAIHQYCKLHNLANCQQLKKAKKFWKRRMGLLVVKP